MIHVKSLDVKYEKDNVVKNCSFSLEKGEILSIIGPNGSGKSTMLKAISGLLPYHHGEIFLENENIKRMKKRDIAQKMCMLSQKNTVPNDMTVGELVSYGRYPYKRWFERLNKEDEDIVNWAIDKTHLMHYKDTNVSSLSGGESQRAWIAMALAQRPNLLLLDEPTTYLDISHQHEVLELVKELNEEMNMTVIMVLHDLNQASRYSDKIFVIQNGEKQIYGKTNDVITEAMIRDVYDMTAEVNHVDSEKAPRVHLICSCKHLKQMEEK
ncbi:MAG TPA: ABC transporter ATP-binding protein [Bacillota bacterium]|nr:ABC transporter ATP-binding protein [Bacillota bacterium]